MNELLFNLAKENYPVPEPLMMKMACSVLVKRAEQYRDYNKKNKQQTSCPLMGTSK